MMPGKYGFKLKATTILFCIYDITQRKKTLCRRLHLHKTVASRLSHFSAQIPPHSSSNLTSTRPERELGPPARRYATTIRLRIETGQQLRFLLVFIHSFIHSIIHSFIHSIIHSDDFFSP